MKIGKKYYVVLFGALMALGMSFSMSLTLTLINIGLVPDFFERWIRAFMIGFLVSFPTSLVITPIVRKIADKLTT